MYWDAGTGKSKVIVDLVRSEPDRKVLILTPKVTIFNWLEQFNIHAGKSVKAIVISGTPEKKRKIVAESAQYQVLIGSYGTARTMGMPKVLPSALKMLQMYISTGELSESGAMAIGKVVRALNDPDVQADFIRQRATDKKLTLADIEKKVAAYVEENGPQWLEDIDYSTIVADESHSIKDTRSQQTKSVLALSRKAARRHLMSGTPTMGNPLHLYPQMRFLAGCIIPEDWLRFSDKFLVRAKYNKRIITGFQNLNILNARVQRVAINKTKAECLDLPERTIIDVPVDMSVEQKKLYNTLISAQAIDLNAFFDNTPESTLQIENAATLLNKLAQVGSGFVINSGNDAQICTGCAFLQTCVAANIKPYTPNCQVHPEPAVREVKYTKDNPKLEALDELLDSVLENDKNKVIIWAVYHAEMDLIEAQLKKKGLDFVRVDGRTGTKVQERITKYNNDPKCRVYLSQVATGVGITLNAASYMIYFATDWSLGTYLQSIDRNYRAGQNEKCTVYRLIGKGTVDEYKVTALDEKKDISATLTSKLTCVTCEQRIYCLKKGVEMFDKDCIYQRSARRTVARPAML